MGSYTGSTGSLSSTCRIRPGKHMGSRVMDGGRLVVAGAPLIESCLKEQLYSLRSDCKIKQRHPMLVIDLKLRK